MTRRILGIDPGTTDSAWLLLVDGQPAEWGEGPNGELLDLLRGWDHGATVVIEEVRSYGMPVGMEVFDTVRWTGRFQEAVCRLRDTEVLLLGRKDVVLHLCNSPRASDANVRAALIDRFGGKTAAIGDKRHPGPMHGLRSPDLRSALAIACTVHDQMGGQTR